jgi:hypothetical protein
VVTGPLRAIRPRRPAVPATPNHPPSGSADSNHELLINLCEVALCLDSPNPFTGKAHVVSARRRCRPGSLGTANARLGESCPAGAPHLHSLAQRVTMDDPFDAWMRYFPVVSVLYM